jgi:site-specific DNA recombinase
VQGQRNHERPFYRCRYPTEYGLANKTEHPATSISPNAISSVPSTPGSRSASPRTGCTTPSTPSTPHSQTSTSIPPQRPAEKLIAKCDRALERHRAALEAGADVQLVTRWITETQARRAEAKARVSQEPEPLSNDQIRDRVERPRDIRKVLAEADPVRKREIYRQLQLQATYHPGKRHERVEANLDPHMWVMVSVRGRSCSLSTTLSVG